jgi:hypothetical protein
MLVETESCRFYKNCSLYQILKLNLKYTSQIVIIFDSTKYGEGGVKRFDSAHSKQLCNVKYIFATITCNIICNK